MAGMFHKGKNLKAVVDQTEKYADAHVVNAALLCAVHAGEAVEIVGLGGACWVELGIFDGVVGFLEANVCANALGL